jgi:hypothetical protein
LVDASISLARCSDIFTQDVEDFDQPAQPAAQPKPEPAKAQAGPRVDVDYDLSKRLLKQFLEVLDEADGKFEIEEAGRTITADIKAKMTLEDVESAKEAYRDKLKAVTA